MTICLGLGCHQSIQVVAQSLVTHKKNSLILEELKWFNLVNGSGNLPTLSQVTFSYLALQSVGNTTSHKSYIEILNWKPANSHAHLPWLLTYLHTEY